MHIGDRIKIRGYKKIPDSHSQQDMSLLVFSGQSYTFVYWVCVPYWTWPDSKP